MAHPVRRALVDRVVQQPGLSVNDLADGSDISRIAIMKHLRILEEADVVLSRKDGRHRRHYFNAVPLQQLTARWMDRYGHFWAERMMQVKDRVETRASAGATRRGRKSA
jgi:DNA-binding transcriptional ArsR family regulator